MAKRQNDLTARIEIGRLSERIDLAHTGSATQNAFGQVVYASGVVSSLWASIIPLRASESIDGAQLVQETKYVVTIRYPQIAVAATAQVTWNDKIYGVSNMQELNRKRYLRFVITERDNGVVQ
jgi:SPP1 family predicted phage head-tail adaptor